MGLLAELKAYLAEKLDVHFTSNNKSHKQLLKNQVKTGDNANLVQNFITINLPKTDPKELEAVMGVLADKFSRGEVVFVDDSSKRLVESVKLAESNPETASIVEFFKDKLTPTDWQILRSGLYIQHLIHQGLPTHEIRQSIIQTHGDRGKNLLNLASSGHFQMHIKPLYEELEKTPHFRKEIFYEELEKILTEMPFAIFVNSADTAATLLEQINEKILSAKAYSVREKKIYIHGWGTNVLTIEQALGSLDPAVVLEINKRKEVVEIIDVVINF